MERLEQELDETPRQGWEKLEQECSPLENMPLPESLKHWMEQSSEVLETRLFSLVGDLTLDSGYGESALIFCHAGLWAYDAAVRPEPVYYPYDALRTPKMIRMYGNAVLKAVHPEDETIVLLRFTSTHTNAADAALRFLEEQQSGEVLCEEAMESVRAVYERLETLCPKCRYQRKDAKSPCMRCEGSRQAVAKFWKYVRPEVGSLGLCLLLSVLSTALALVPPFVTGKIMVDQVLPAGDARGLFWTIVLLLGVYALQHSISAFRSYRLRVTGSRMMVAMRKDLYAKTQALTMSFFDKTGTGGIVNRISNDTAVVQQFILRLSQEAVVKVFLLLGLIVIMVSMDWKLALLSFVPVPLVVFGGRVFGKKIAPMYRRLWRRSSAMYGLLCDNIPGVRVIKAFTNERAVTAKYNRFADEWLGEEMRASKVASTFPNVLTFFMTCGSLVIWAVGGGAVIRNPVGALTIGTLVTFISYASQFYDPVNFLATLGDGYQNAMASVEKISDILDEEPEHNFGTTTLSRPRGKIEFRHVDFAFDQSKKVLHDVSFVIEPGDVVGIVGTTGSGKSTLINLLLRYYDDYEGGIFLDDTDVRSLDLSFYRNQIGFVQQEPQMFRDTILQNIAYGIENPHAEQVLAAAQIANAHSFISRLPEGYDTILGERGIGLSGGERQRLSIARAVLKNPSILVFDEATAAVDSETEKLIQEAIEHLIRGRTTLMIAHRLSTLRKANKIIVVDKGNIIEFGHPAELLAQKGKYYKLVQIQSMAEEAEKQRVAERFD